jgi:hypothetical protein
MRFAGRVTKGWTNSEPHPDFALHRCSSVLIEEKQADGFEQEPPEFRQQ